jgi:hypothetical protein
MKMKRNSRKIFGVSPFKAAYQVFVYYFNLNCTAMLHQLKSRFLWLLLSTALVSIAGCGICTCKKIICPAFNDPFFEKWAPYSKDQLLVFKNLPGAADTIRIINTQKSDAYEGRTGGGYGCSKGCFSSMDISGTDASGSDYNKFRISADKGNSPEQGKTNVSFYLGRTYFNATAITDTGFTLSNYYQSIPAISKFLNTVTIGNKLFSNTQVITIDTFRVKTAGAYKFYFSKDAGLVGWENYPDKTLWVKE